MGARDGGLASQSGSILPLIRKKWACWSGLESVST